MKYKIIEFLGSMNDGGAETLVKDYAILLDKKIFDVLILTIYGLNDSANSNRIRKNNINVISIFNKRTFLTRVIKKIIGKWYIPFKIKKIIDQEKPNGIHIHLELLRYIKPISKDLKKMDIKLFYTCHNIPNKYFTGKNRVEFKAAVELIQNNGLQIIALHEEMKNELNAIFGIENTLVLTNGIDFNKFKLSSLKLDNIRKEIGLNQDNFVIGHIGRFTKQKNHIFLIQIFEAVYKTLPNARLILIGNGETKEVIKEKIKKMGLDNVIIFLHDREDIPELLNCMDVFLFPSLYEGLSVTLIEAQVCGLRCVVSNTINKESFLSELVHPISLDEPIEVWKNAVLNNNYRLERYENIEKYNLCITIKKLELLYLNREKVKK